MRTQAPMGLCATPGSSGTQSCRWTLLSTMSSIIIHVVTIFAVASIPILKPTHFFKHQWMRSNFSQASLQLDQETGTITVTDNRYFDRETKESESNDIFCILMSWYPDILISWYPDILILVNIMIMMIISSLHHDRWGSGQWWSG